MKIEKLNLDDQNIFECRWLIEKLEVAEPALKVLMKNNPQVQEIYLAIDQILHQLEEHKSTLD